MYKLSEDGDFSDCKFRRYESSETKNDFIVDRHNLVLVVTDERYLEKFCLLFPLHSRKLPDAGHRDSREDEYHLNSFWGRKRELIAHYYVCKEG